MKRLLTICAVVAFILAVTGVALGDTHYADPLGSNVPPYTTPATAAHKIQDAIDAAGSGDTVDVAAGTYTEFNIAVDKQLTLLGAQADVDPRNGARAWDNASESRVDASNQGDGFVVTADNVVINGFTVINAATGGTFDTAHPGRGIFIVESSNCEVKYNVLYNNTWRGIRIWSNIADAANNSVHHNLCYTSDSSVNGRAGISVSGPRTHDNTIEHNECHHCDGGIVPSADAHLNTIRYNNCHDNQRGISLNWGANNNTVEYNEIKNNSECGITHSGPGGGWGAAHHNIVRNNTLDGNGGADDTGGNGIGLSTDCHDNLVENNTITNSGDFGINLHKAVDNTIRGNTVNNSGRIGISVWDNCTGNVIEDNSVNGTRRHQGIKVAHWSVTGCANNTFCDNEVRNATSHGIFVYKATNTTITGNTVYDNGGDGIKVGNTADLECSSTTTVNCNNISGNTGYGVNNHHYDGGVPPLLNAELNWWGDNSGPYHPTTNPGGLGDAVSDNVDYDPWTLHLTCSGFEPPMDGGPVKVKKSRVLPLKAELLDGDYPLTDVDIIAPPVIQVMFSSSGTADVVDVTDLALSAGQGTEGNEFVFTGSNWQFNLKTKLYTAKGTYTVTMVSADECEYVIESACTAQFVIK